MGVEVGEGMGYRRARGKKGRKKGKRLLRRSSDETDPSSPSETDDDLDEDDARYSLLDTLGGLQESEHLSDVHFLVGPPLSDRRRIPAHRLILSARSEVFQRMLYGRMREGTSSSDIEVPDLDPASFSSMLRFVYSARSDLSPDTGSPSLSSLSLLLPPPLSHLLLHLRLLSLGKKKLTYHDVVVE